MIRVRTRLYRDYECFLVSFFFVGGFSVVGQCGGCQKMRDGLSFMAKR